jgi:hypothetical protein
VAIGQSVFARQTAQVPSGAHSFPVCDAQSVLVRHSTQLEVIVSQMGAIAEHPALDVHPARQLKSCGSQMGMAVPQSALLRQFTHWPWPTRQRGWLVGQSEFVSHCTHCDVVGSQIGPIIPIWVAAVQSVDVLQPTHDPFWLVVSQMGVTPWQSALLAQAAWQVWSPGQHAGVATGQSESERH